jgi:predicted esterase
MIAASLFIVSLTSFVHPFTAHSAAHPHASAPVALSEDLPDKPPDAMAKPLQAYAWKSKNELRFVWWLPKDYDPEHPRNLTVICHGTGLDFRWGYWNNKPGIFRPNDIVVSVDGPTPDRDTRLFMDSKSDVEAFSAFLKEMRGAFAVDRIFLYGHSQGGFFVVHFAGEHPDQIEGVVAHASGAWLSSKTRGDVQKRAIAFLHGSSDPVVPYVQSPGSRDAYVKAGFDLVHLRRLDRYNHWPNAVRVTETLNWCQGMTAKTPEEALGCAVEILKVKKPDEYQWTTTVGFAGARDVLRRIEKKGPRPFEDVPESVAKDAADLIEKIEAAGAEQVAELKKELKGKKSLKLGEGAWLGRLVPLREDYRGVDSVEAFLKEIGYDALEKSQEKAGNAIRNAWYQEKDPKKIYEAVVENIGKAFLFDGYPPELGVKMKEWDQSAKNLKISAASQKRYADFEMWEDAWKSGLKAYAETWKGWKGP